LSYLLLLSILLEFAVTGQPGGIEREIYTARAMEAGIEQFSVRWSNLVDITQIYYGGLFSNFMDIILEWYWLFRSNLCEPASIFLLVFLSIGVIPPFYW
jgi:hypothetical protein